MTKRHPVLPLLRKAKHEREKREPVSAGRISTKAWQQMCMRTDFKDISHELPSEFMVIGQWMRAKILVDGKKFYASGWAMGGASFVDLTLAEK